MYWAAFAHKARTELLHDASQTVVEDRQRSIGDLARHAAIMRFGDSARNARQRVRIATERDRLSHGVFVPG